MWFELFQDTEHNQPTSDVKRTTQLQIFQKEKQIKQLLDFLQQRNIYNSRRGYSRFKQSDIIVNN